uniref:F5/8 type C domain-containing protein n=1 Tax=Astyanax mexicanus TaxID=7994 RepID=A0A8B9RDC3_ASTMX
MINTALSSFGAQVVLATSSDENHPPENILDGKTETFWLSTGMFPQEFIIRFPDNMKVSLISVHSFNVKHLRIEKNTLEEADKFQVMAEKGKNPQSAQGLHSLNNLKLHKIRLSEIQLTRLHEFCVLEFEQTENSLQTNDISVSPYYFTSY